MSQDSECPKTQNVPKLADVKSLKGDYHDTSHAHQMACNPIRLVTTCVPAYHKSITSVIIRDTHQLGMPCPPNSYNCQAASFLQ
jgi:hypothetical protein